MKKLEKIAKLVEELDFKLHRLRRYGFVRKRVRYACNISFIMIHHELGIVVKRPFLIERQEQPPFAVPTKILRVPGLKLFDELSLIFIQPLVDVSRDAQAHAYSILWESPKQISDLKRGNCGLYRRKPVVFDW